MPKIRPCDPCPRLDIDVIPENDILKGNTFFDLAVTADHAVGKACITFDPGVVSQNDHAGEFGLFVDLGVRADKYPLFCRPGRLMNLYSDFAVTDVLTRLEVCLRIADVGPVALQVTTKQAVCILKHFGEDILGPVTIFPLRDQLQNFRLQNIDTRVDGVGKDFSPTGLLKKLGDAGLFVGDNNTELKRVGDRCQGNGRFRLFFLMECNCF